MAVLDKTLKGIRGLRPDNQKVLRTPRPKTKYFERLFYCSINYNKCFLTYFYLPESDFF